MCGISPRTVNAYISLPHIYNQVKNLLRRLPGYMIVRLNPNSTRDIGNGMIVSSHLSPKPFGFGSRPWPHGYLDKLQLRI
jgi:hypothetical protein